MEKYHISTWYTRRYLTLKPRVPKSAGPEEDIDTWRVCFCPTVKQAIFSIVGIARSTILANEVIAHFILLGSKVNIYNLENEQQLLRNPAVYVTRKKLFVPKKQADFEHTGELWSLDKITLTRKGFVDLSFLFHNGKVRITQDRTSTITKREARIYWNAAVVHKDKFLG